MLHLFGTLNHVGLKKTSQFRNKDVTNRYLAALELHFFWGGGGPTSNNQISDVHLLWNER